MANTIPQQIIINPNPTSAPRKNRLTQACDNCHRKRVRCDGRNPCRNCSRRDISCEWRAMKKRGPKPKTNSRNQTVRSATSIANLVLSTSEEPRPQADISNNGSAGSPSISEDDSSHEGIVAPPVDNLIADFYSAKVDAELREAIIAFFDYAYAYMPIVHPSTFLRSVVEGKAEAVLLDAIRALTAKYIMYETGRRIPTAALIDSVKSRVLLNLEKPTLNTVQALVILINAEVRGNRDVAMATFLAAAVGLVMRLGWHEIDLYKTRQPKTWEEWVEAETKRRLFWSIFLYDCYSSIMRGHPTLIPEPLIYVRSPSADEEWDDVSFVLANTAADAHPTVRQARPQTIITGAISRSFELLCKMGTTNSRVSQFLNSAKAGRCDQQISTPSDRPFPAVDFLSPSPESTHLVYSVHRKARVISDYPEFSVCSRLVQDLHESVPHPELLREMTSNAGGARFFGNADHGLLATRVRYLSLKVYTCSTIVILHISNRRSFFDEFERPPDLDQVFNAVGTAAAPASDVAIRQTISSALGTFWSQGLVADDIEQESWDTAVEYAHSMAGYLKRNDDLPHSRLEFAVGLCIFNVACVLVRQNRRCRNALQSADDSQWTLQEWDNELHRTAKSVRILWQALNRLGAFWNVEGFTSMLRLMKIDECTEMVGRLAAASL
ncbi:hypothetical protein EC988_001308 [Linderina pennispora]|nr:hypothetical protein EC988_001308 [Linderina pennispora]